MFLCFQSCKGFVGISELLQCGVVGEMDRSGRLWWLLLCGCEGTGTQGSRAFSLRYFLTHSGKAGLGCPWLLFCDSHDFFLVAKIHADPLKPLWRVGGILWALWVPKARTGARVWLREWLHLGRQTCAKEVVRKAEQIPIEFLQSYITPNSSGSSPLHHSPVNEISWLLLALDESICQTHKSLSNTSVL